MTYVIAKQADENWIIRAADNTVINPMNAKLDPAK